MKIPGLSQDTIEANADRSSFERGRQYFESGAVKSLKRRSDRDVEAYVQGSDIAPYHVEIRHDSSHIVSAECSCPYVTGSWCRHIVAALLAVIQSEGTLSRPLDEMLGDFSRVELIRLIERIVDLHPQAAGVVEDEFSRHS